MSCPVCFNAGIADDTVRSSMNLGIGVLLAVTAVVLAGFLRFIVSIARRSKAADLKVGLYDSVHAPAGVEAGLQTGLSQS
jgi:hypothetical protein